MKDIRLIRRSNRDARIFGVCAGIAQWAELDVRTFQIFTFLIILFTGFFPGAIIYVVLALVIPADNSYSNNYYYNKYEDKEDPYYDKTTDELRKEYEELKKKVESMENDMFDKEIDWDQRFHKE